MRAVGRSAVGLASALVVAALLVIVFGWSFSPDHRRLAAGSDVTAELRLYDLPRLRVVGDVELVKPSVHGLVYASTWASSSRVLATVVSPRLLRARRHRRQCCRRRLAARPVAA